MHVFDPRLIRSVGALLLGLFASACGGNGDEGVTPAEDPSQDFTRLEVTWKRDAVLLDDVALVREALVRVSSSAGELVLRPDLPGLDQLQPGRAAMIGGVGIFTVDGRETTAEGELVRVTRAPLTAVIESGEVAWRKSFVAAAPAERVGLGGDQDETEIVRRLSAPLVQYSEDGELTFSGTVAGFETELTLKEDEAGALDLAISTKREVGSGHVNAALHATVTGMVNEASIILADGNIHAFDMRFASVAGEASVEAGGVSISGDAKLAIPASLALPFLVGGVLPMHVALGASLEFSSTLKLDTSAILRGNVRFAGEAGARTVQGRPEYYSSFGLTDLNVESGDHVATVTSGFGAMLTFPEVKVGIGASSVAGAEAFLRFKSEAVSNVEVEVESAGGFPVVTGFCVTSGTNFGATGGATIDVLGVTVARHEVPVYGRVGPASKRGDTCE